MPLQLTDESTGDVLDMLDNEITFKKGTSFSKMIKEMKKYVSSSLGEQLTLFCEEIN